MLRSSRDGLVIIDKEGVVLEINGVFTQLTKVDHSQIVNHPINELTHSESTSEALLYGALQSLLKSENADVREIPFSDKILEIYSPGDDSSLDVCILSVRNITDQKLKDKKLAEYQLRATAAFELSFELIGILDTQGVLLDVNRAALEMIDAQRNDVVGSFFWETPWWTHSPETALQIHDFIIKAAEGEFIHAEVTHCAVDGSLRYMDFTLKPVRDESGYITALIPEGRDITALRLQTIELDQQRLMFETIINSIPQAIFWKDRNSVYQGCNELFCKVAGISSPKEIVGKSDFDLPWKKEEAEAYRSDDRDVIDSVKSKLHIIEPASGKNTLIVDTSKVPLVNTAGEVFGILGIFNDVTEQLRREQETVESQTLIKAILDSTEDVIVMVDPDDYTFIIWNKAVEDFSFNRTGVSIEKGLRIDKLYDKKYIEFWKSMLDKTRINGSHQFEYTGPTGQVILFNLYLLTSKGKAFGFALFGKDITKIRTSETNMKLAQKMAHIGSWTFEIRCKRMQWSDELFNIFEFNPVCFSGTFEEHLNSIHPDDRENFAISYNQSLKNQIPFSMDHRLLMKDGRIKYVHEECVSMFDADGNALISRGTVQDITERTIAELALKESERKYRSIFENATEGIFQSTPEGRFLSINPAMVKTLGYNSVEEMKAGVKDIKEDLYVNPYDRRHLLNSMIKDGTISDYEVEMKRKDGRRIWVSISARVVAGEQGVIHFFEGTLTDVTDRRLAECELRESEEKYRMLLDSANELIVVVQNGMFKYVNKLTVELSGYSEQTLFADPFTKWIHPEDCEKVVENYTKRIANDPSAPPRYKFRFFRADNSIRWVEISSVVIDWNNRPATLNFLTDITERLQAEEQINMLKRSIDVLSEGAYWFGLDNTFVYVNEAGARALGYTKEEMIGKTIFDINSIATVERLDHHWEVLKKSGSYTSESVHYRKDGTEFPVEIRSSYVQFAGKELCCGFAVDISKRKEAEQALHESEERYRHLLESVTGYVYTVIIKDGNSISTRHSEGCFAVTGYRPVEFSNDNTLWITMVPQDDRRKVLAMIGRIRKEKVILTLEHRIFDKSGVVKWISATLVPHVDSRGELTSYDGLISDITERISAQMALQESESRFRQITENMQEVFFLYEKEGHKPLYLSPVMKRLFGIPPEMVFNDRALFDRAVHPEDVLKVDFIHEDRFYSRPLNEEFRIILADGEVRWVRLRSFLVLDERNNVARVAGLLSDITDFKNAQERSREQQLQLIQADKMVSLGVLISGVAHEINNPTNFITLNTPLLKRICESVLPILDQYTKENGEFQIGGMSFSQLVPNIVPLIEGIANGAKRIQHIVSDLKEYARLDSSTIDQDVDLNKVVKSAISLVNHMIRKKTDNFRIELYSEPLILKGNFQRIEQVVINLLQNAGDALTGKTQAILVKTVAVTENEKIALIVSDEGCGISAGDLLRITDPFFTTKRECGGTGLGLSISAGIVKDHGGTLRFESTSGQGTKVILELPSYKSHKTGKNIPERVS